MSRVWTENDRGDNVMRFVGKILLLPVLLLLFIAVNTHAQRFETLVSKSIFADKRAFYEGDLVTILLMEFTEGENQTGTSTNSDNQLRADATSSGFIDSVIPSFGVDSQLKNRHDASGSTRSKGKLTGKMSARIIEVLDNGLLKIQGMKVVDVNGEKQETTLTGLVRPEDIRPDNTVYSFNVASAMISYKGRGMVTKAGKPGIIARIWNWIF